MNRLAARRLSPLLLLCVGMLLSFAATDPHRKNGGFIDEYERWRRQRLEGLRSESGWLTLVGLHWLQPDENRFGSDPGSRVPLPEGKAPAFAGSFFLQDGKVRVAAAPGSQVSLNGQPVSDRELKSDESGEPDVLRLGDLSLFVIKRGDRYA